MKVYRLLLPDHSHNLEFVEAVTVDERGGRTEVIRKSEPRGEQQKWKRGRKKSGRERETHDIVLFSSCALVRGDIFCKKIMIKLNVLR